MTQQIAFRVEDELAEAIDQLVSRGRYPTRASMIRTALATLIEAERRRAVDEAIADGYRAMPETDDELAPAHLAAARLVSDPDLPW